MSGKKKILAISGSTRKASSNLNLIHAIVNLTKDIFSVETFEGLTDIPHFNPDALNTPPQAVLDFRKALSAADAILICTPEYAIGVPGTLKNAIDWTVSSMEFSQKPVALITASTSGLIAHQSLLGTLLIIEAKITDDTQFVISSVKTKVNAANMITDVVTLQKVEQMIASLNNMIKKTVPETVFLTAPILMNG